MQGLAILNWALQENPDVWYWGANTLRESMKMVNIRLPYASSTDIIKKSISFKQRAMNCNLSANNVESKQQFYSDSHACPSSLEISGKSMNTNYRKTLDCANYLCNQRGIHAVDVMGINILDIKEVLQIYVKSLNLLYM